MPLLAKETEIFPESIFESSEPWSVAHVRSRHEKMLARHLLQHGIPFYVPLMVREISRRGRRVTSYLPLFGGYVFFRGGRPARQAALGSDAVVSLIDVEDQARLGGELHQIRRLQLAGASLVPVDELAAGDAVRITEGVFAGYEGTIVRSLQGQRLLVMVSLLRKTVAVEYPQAALRRRE